MKKFLLSVLVVMLCFSSIFILTACGIEDDNRDEGNLDTNRAYLSDYTLPENFAITIKLIDTSIISPGDPWYFKTAKIGNDWQIIEYDRNAGQTEQTTHFFRYVSQDNYDHYTYNHQTSTWSMGVSVTFEGMLQTSLNNFLFLKKWERLNSITVTETNIQYDVDPTSNTSLIDAILYEFTNGLDYSEKVDAQYTDISLYHLSMDGSRVCYQFFAYEYTKTLTDWSSAYLSYRYYQSDPSI